MVEVPPTKIICLDCVAEAELHDAIPWAGDLIIWVKCHGLNFTGVLKPETTPGNGNATTSWPEKQVLQYLSKTPPGLMDYPEALTEMINCVGKLSFRRRYLAAIGGITGWPENWSSQRRDRAEQLLEQLVGIVGDLLKSK